MVVSKSGAYYMDELQKAHELNEILLEALEEAMKYIDATIVRENLPADDFLHEDDCRAAIAAAKGGV